MTLVEINYELTYNPVMQAHVTLNEDFSSTPKGQSCPSITRGGSSPSLLYMDSFDVQATLLEMDNFKIRTKLEQKNLMNIFLDNYIEVASI